MHFLNRKYSLVCMVGAMSLLSACAFGGESGKKTSVQTKLSEAVTPPVSSNNLIKINQVGYLPSRTKIALVPNTNATRFEVINVADGQVAMAGDLPVSQKWSLAGNSVHIADFSAVTEAGQYIIRVAGFPDSKPVNISRDAYLDLHDGALKAYYFNRAGLELDPTYAGDWARPLGHPDTNVLVHSSAATVDRPAGTVLSSPKGWYDAGDYNKYIVNSGISTYTLLASYTDFTDFYQGRDVDIPESGDDMPDILDEILWNIDWMETMQDPRDGGVYHKLTTLNFEAPVMPHNATSQRYVVQKNVGAALNFAGVMAKASRVFAEVPGYANKAQEYRSAAIKAFEWAQDNPTLYYQQPSDVSTGEYGDQNVDGESAWAAAELFLLTQNTDYLDLYKQKAGSPSTPNWQDTMTLAYMSLLREGKTLLSNEDYESVKSQFMTYADSVVNAHNASAYRVAMLEDDFVWGSNAVALNKAMVLLQAYSLDGEQAYHSAAVGLVDYVLGRNPIDFSFVTGFGVKTPMDTHHRQSYADDVTAPVPGFVAGGPHTGRQDDCDYEGRLPATTYSDDWCSYSTNEVTINWNAPLVYVLSALHTSQ